jgi:hypothetical protein
MLRSFVGEKGGLLYIAILEVLGASSGCGLCTCFMPSCTALLASCLSFLELEARGKGRLLNDPFLARFS